MPVSVNTRDRPWRLLFVLAAVLIPGCYAAVGPSIGIVLPQGRPTFGWELSAVTGEVGQVFASSGPPVDGRPAWTRRTFLVWEPRMGATIGSSGILAGGGLTFGASWDRSQDSSARAGGEFLFGFWGGAVVPYDRHTNYLSGQTMPYLSISLGVRGDELYLAPMVGVLQEPTLTIGFGGGGFN